MFIWANVRRYNTNVIAYTLAWIPCIYIFVYIFIILIVNLIARNSKYKYLAKKLNKLYEIMLRRFYLFIFIF